MAAHSQREHPGVDHVIEGLGEVTNDLSQVTDKSENPNALDNKESSPITIKEITKKLIRPYAAITFFHPAVLIGIDELSLYLTDWTDSKSVAYARGLQVSFLILARSIKVHTDHQMEGLYPEIRSFLQIQRRKRNHEEFSNIELQIALTQIQMFMSEHNANIQTLRNIGECITIFTEKVKVRAQSTQSIEGDQEIDGLFQSVTESIKSWIPKYKQQLSEHNEFLKPWIPKIAANKVDEIKLVKGIIDSPANGREGILKFQFGFVVSKLVASGDWTCEIQGDTYSRNETLAAYIRCFQMTSTEHEYRKILKLIPKHIPQDIWRELQLYGLDQPGSFRFSQQVAEAHITDVCSQNLTCANEDDQCIVL